MVLRMLRCQCRGGGDPCKTFGGARANDVFGAFRVAHFFRTSSAAGRCDRRTVEKDFRFPIPPDLPKAATYPPELGLTE